ncbi:MAG: porin [Pseudomonadota bacterium]|nr:porin [Pseudomonadota bacterium]
MSFDRNRLGDSIMSCRFIDLVVRFLTITLSMTTVALPGFAQQGLDAATQEQILRELQILRKRVEKLEQENRELRGEEEPPTPAPVAIPATQPPAEKAPETVAATDEPDTEPESKITAGYNKNAVNGFFIGDESGQFRLNIGAYTQVRYNTNWRNGSPAGEDDFTQGFSINRTRFFFEGQYTDPLKYHLRLNIDDTGNADLIAAYLQYAFTPHWGIRVGEQFMALSREDWMYAQDVLGLEFSPNDFTFAIGSSIGIQPQYVSDNYR